jgi:putative ABC transport system permease protein
MTWLRQARTRWRKFVHRRQLDRDLEDEILFHLEMRARSNREAGLPPEAALNAARRQFGNPFKWKEAIREMWSLGLIESVIKDVRYAARSLAKTPVFTVTALLALTLGIGCTTAIFSLVNAVMLRSLPFQGPERLALLWGNVQRQKVERRGNSYPDYLDWKAQSTSFTGIAAYQDDSFTRTGTEEAERIPGEWVSAGYFELLGVAPIAGRTILPDEDRVGNSAAVVVISDGLWKRRFGSAPGILGEQLHLNDRAFTVIGIMPSWFRGLTDAADIWAPFTASGPASDFADRGTRGFPAVARLRPDQSLRQAQLEMDGISARLEQQYPDTNSKRAVEVAPLTSELVGDLRTPLLLLLGSVSLVLLIACANVANLLVARSEARRLEIAIRMALGAGRRRVFRQLITESLALSFGGALLGALLSVWFVGLLSRLSPITLPSFIKASPDWRVAGFTMAVSVMVGIAAGLLPALQGGRHDVQSWLQDSRARSGAGRARRRFRAALVVAEVALAMTLLVGAGLLMRSFRNLASFHPGYDASGVLSLSVALPQLPPSQSEAQPTQPAAQQPVLPGQAGQPKAQVQTGLEARTIITGRQILQRIRAIPSVVSASVSSDIPLGGTYTAIFYGAEGQPMSEAETRPRAYIHWVTPEFFQAAGAPVLAGRTFTETEIESHADVVVVTQNLTKRFWAGQDPIGKRIKRGDPDSKSPWLTIIGTVGEMKYRGLPDNPTADPDIFLPFSDRIRNVAILIRSSATPSSLGDAARTAIHEISPSIPTYEVSTMSERVGQAIERSRFASWMMTVFAGLALVLASIGLYGVMSYSVRLRTRELGVRIAIGARPSTVAGAVVRDGMLLVVIGIAIGIAAALGLTRLLNTLLFGVGAMDPPTIVGVAVLLAFVALIACYLPARKASRIDPVAALRSE